MEHPIATIPETRKSLSQKVSERLDIFDTRHLISLVDETMKRGLSCVPERLREAVGLLRVKSDVALMKSITDNGNKSDRLISKLASIGPLISGLAFSWALISNKGDPDYGSIIYCMASIILILTISTAVWATSYMIINLLHSCFGLTIKNVSSIKESGWDGRMLKSCQRMSALGMTLPPPLLVLVPHMHENTVSTTVMRVLGDDDTVSMLILTEMMEGVASEAERARRDLLPVQQLTLRGESSELLDRVAGALNIDDDRKRVDFLV